MLRRAGHSIAVIDCGHTRDEGSVDASGTVDKAYPGYEQAVDSIADAAYHFGTDTMAQQLKSLQACAGMHLGEPGKHPHYKATVIASMVRLMTA